MKDMQKLFSAYSDASEKLDEYQFASAKQAFENSQSLYGTVMKLSIGAIVVDRLLRQVRDEAEYKAIVKALARVEGNIVKASELLGVSRPTLYDLMDRHAIRPTVASA